MRIRWLWRSVAFCAVVAAPLLASAALEEETLEAALKKTRGVIAEHHLISLVEIEPLDGSNETKFRYDRYPDVERVQMKDGVYARRKPKGWLKSADWAKTGTKVKPAKAEELDHLVSVIDAPLHNTMVTRDASQGGTVVRLLRREPQESGERIFFEVGREKATGVLYPQFVVERGQAQDDSEALLVGFAGLMYSGDERVKVNINYSYMFLVEMKPAASPNASPKARG